MAGYVDAVPAFVCFELPAREASSFCDFWKLTSCNFIAFISSLIEVNFCFFKICLLRINLPNLCPNMIHVDALDFSGWHSEEVISFFWRSVYLPQCVIGDWIVNNHLLEDRIGNINHQNKSRDYERGWLSFRFWLKIYLFHCVMFLFVFIY